MNTEIHPTAIIDDQAEIGLGVSIGPFAIVEKSTRIGDGSQLLARTHIMTGTTIGRNNQVHPGAVLGNTPQDRAFDADTRSYLSIGDGNIFRENTTVHRATTPEGTTVIGDNGFFMANSHIAHDVTVGDEVVICNNTTLAGYVTVGDRAFFSGNVVVHQFTRIGDLCMLGGGAGAGQDAPPFTTVIGRSQIRGLNVVGMRRAGFDLGTRNAVKELYRQIFACRGSFAEVLTVLDRAPDLPETAMIQEFYRAESKRGFMWPPASRDDRLDERSRTEENR